MVRLALPEKQWAPTALLAYMVETGLLVELEVAEAIVAFEKQTEVWLPASRDQACSVIGKFTQGAKADGKDSPVDSSPTRASSTSSFVTAARAGPW